MYSRNYINDDLLANSIRNSKDILLTSEDICAWNFKPHQSTALTQFNFFPVHSRPKKNRSPPMVKAPEVKTSFKKKPNPYSLSPVFKNQENKKLCKSLDESEYKLLEFMEPKRFLPPLKATTYNMYYKTAAKERTLEGFLNRCKEMIRESRQNRMKSASPFKLIKKINI